MSLLSPANLVPVGSFWRNSIAFKWYYWKTLKSDILSLALESCSWIPSTVVRTVLWFAFLKAKCIFKVFCSICSSSNNCVVGFGSLQHTVAVVVPECRWLASFMWLTACHGSFLSPAQAHVAVVMHFPPWACWKQEYVSWLTTLRNPSLVPSRLYLAASILRVSTLVYTQRTSGAEGAAEGDCILATSHCPWFRFFHKVSVCVLFLFLKDSRKYSRVVSPAYCRDGIEPEVASCSGCYRILGGFAWKMGSI